MRLVNSKPGSSDFRAMNLYVLLYSMPSYRWVWGLRGQGGGWSLGLNYFTPWTGSKEARSRPPHLHLVLCPGRACRSCILRKVAFT